MSGEGRLFVGVVEVEFCFVAEDEHEAELDAPRYAREEIRNQMASVHVREIKRAAEIPAEWRGLGRETPLVWGARDDITAEDWLEAHPHVPTDAEKEAVGQLNAFGGEAACA